MVTAGVTTKQYMDTWLLQINYPEVAVILNNTATQSQVEFVQERYSVTEIDETWLFDPIKSPFK